MRWFPRGVAALVVTACGRPARELAPIRLEAVETLGADSGAGAMVTVPTVSARHPGGFRIVIPGASGVPASPLVYGDNGKFVGELAGGPAGQQFQTPLFTRFGPGDSLWVFDASQQAFVFGPDRRFARSVSLPVSPWDALVLPDGRLLIAPANADRPLPLQLLSGDGALIREIGASDTAAAPVIAAPRWLMRDRDGTFWSMPTQFRWRLEHWDTTGASLGEIERHPAWFTAYRKQLPVTPTRAPQPLVLGAWLDDTGRLWVLGATADVDWKAGLGAPRRGQRGDVIVSPDKVFDTVIEMIDPRSGELLASTRVDPEYASVVSAGVIMRTGETHGGWKQAILMRVILDSTGRGDAANAPTRR